MSTLQEAQEDYLNRWKRNAEQHFRDGDYEWVASLVKKTGAESVLEIGCGVGYSTLALANQGLRVFSIDPIPQAIDATKELLGSYQFSVGIAGETEATQVLLKQANVIENYEEVSKYAEDVELILLCNPGGKLESDLTTKENEMLHWGKYSDDQVNEEQVSNLHRWAVIIAAARLAKEKAKLLVIIDRGNIDELDPVLDIIPISTGMQGRAKTVRKLCRPPKDGIQFGGNDSDMYWGAGLFEPFL